MTPAIVLGRMPQQTSVYEDDWTGVTNPSQRRKLQNRLNQRLYRKRRRAKPCNSKEACSTKRRHIPGETIDDSEKLISSLDNGSSSSYHGTRDSSGLESSVYTVPTIRESNKSIHFLTFSELREIMVRYENEVKQQQALGSPYCDRLLTLVQFNVLRALFINAACINCPTEWCDEEALSPWCRASEEFDFVDTPASLKPTGIQKLTAHHPWIDLFPFPHMRDTLLLAGDSYDEYALCNLLVDFCDVTHEETGLIVWSDPWDPSGWEVSEHFIATWGWTVKGCHELRQSTNKWRRRRGEPDLLF